MLSTQSDRDPESPSSLASVVSLVSGPDATADQLGAGDRHYRVALETLPDGVVLCLLNPTGDGSGHPEPLLANPAALHILGVDLQTLRDLGTERSQAEVLDVDGSPLGADRTLTARVVANQGPVDDHHWGFRRAPDAPVTWIRSSGRPIFDDDGRITSLVTSLVDVTAERQAFDQLETAHARYEALIEHSTDVIVIIAADGTVLYASPSYERVLGSPAAEATGQSIFGRIHPVDQVRAQIELIELARRAMAVSRFPCRVRAGDGQWRHFEVSCTNRLDDVAVGGIVANCRDVTEQVQATAELAHHASHDQLTGLANRVLLLDRLDAALARAKRSSRPLALFFLDLDNFKRVNDTLGHPAGDHLLTIVAARLTAALRPGDSVARFGGDEFVVLAEDMISRSDALATANRLRSIIAEPIDLDGRLVSIGCSVGISVSCTDEPDAVIQEADIALFRAKAEGRGAARLYSTAMRALPRDQLDSEELLRRALDEDRVLTLYQPIVDLSTGRFTSVEALARIVDRDGTIITPDRFITVAEDNGLIVPLGERILGTACSQLARWRQMNVGIDSVTVNLSARQLTAGGLPRLIQRTLEMANLDGRHLGLEITESSLIDAGSSARQQLDQLKALGARILLDDFGTGWSSLAYLRRFPVDGIKVDRSFVAGLGRSSSDTELVRAIVSLGHSLSLAVIAEGVETEDQRGALRDLGCRSAQGYLFSRPVPAEELTHRLQSVEVA